ncbi:MAG: hypothetical protein J5772_01325 [Clostridia bacterium]|nr:hypothetical protein [Clostridia bacterium]
MYQESTDKLKGSAKSDTLLFVILIAFFFLAGTVATVLRAKFNSSVPLYVLAAVFGGLLYLVYRLRLVGFRYTVFHKAPEPEYDARFDDYITHEDYPYPVGTVVVERIVSAKGTILLTLSKDELISVLAPEEQAASDEELVLCPCKKEKASSILFNRDGKTIRAYIAASDEFLGYVRGIIEA